MPKNSQNSYPVIAAWLRHIAQLLVTLWVGSLWTIGYLAAPVLFASLPDKMLAGKLAGNMFTLTAYIGMGSATYLLIYLISQLGCKKSLRNLTFLSICTMLLLTLIAAFALQPMMASLKEQVAPADVMHTQLAAKFGMLHGIAEVLYLVQSLLGIVLVFRANRHIE